MVATSSLVQLALLPCLVIGSSIAPRAKSFDYDSLTLREVGARNTLVSGALCSAEHLTYIFRIGASGLRKTASLFPSGMMFLSTLRMATIVS